MTFVSQPRARSHRGLDRRERPRVALEERQYEL
mgnify:CR=1 FL=1